jgi:hypothetical protein
MKLRGDELGFITVCSRNEYRMVFIWLRVYNWEERVEEVRSSSGQLSAALLLEYADKVCRPVIRSDQLTKLYFITNPTD